MVLRQGLHHVAQNSMIKTLGIFDFRSKFNREGSPFTKDKPEIPLKGSPTMECIT